jgi:putative sigma-54 modulation protein
VQIAISARHGSLSGSQHTHLEEKAQKLTKIFGRLMSIGVSAEQRKNDWQVEILASAEHKHDFVALEHAATPEAAMDLCVQKIESQLRRYKEKVQGHRDAVPQGGTSPEHPDLPEPPPPV